MQSVTSPVPHVKPRSRKPLLPVEVLGRFVAPPTDEDLLIGAAVLEIEDAKELMSYWCQASTERGNIIGWSLRRFGFDETYDLPASLDSCDCPDGTYRPERPGGCRHQQALRQALAARPNVVVA
jgi:hypothetical protein